MIPSSEISFQTLTVHSPIFSALLGVLSKREAGDFHGSAWANGDTSSPLDFWGPVDGGCGLQEREMILTCWITAQIFWLGAEQKFRTTIKVYFGPQNFFFSTLRTALCEQKATFPREATGCQNILCLRMEAPASIQMLLATAEGFNVSSILD